jgi:uncharacterized iron-regulated membrane protein
MRQIRNFALRLWPPARPGAAGAGRRGAGGPEAERHYLLIWRWHFYAALYVMPFLLMLALTGLVMLWIAFSTELNGERLQVEPRGAPLAVSALQAAAEAAAGGGSARLYIEPLAADRVAVFKVQTAQGALTVLVDPYTGAVLDRFAWRAGWYDTATAIHASLLIGTPGDRLIEIAASLGIMLVASGLYLHWPRGRGGWRGALLPVPPAPVQGGGPGGRARGRALWRGLHGAVGLWVGALLVLFLLTGLSWTGVWGGRLVQPWASYPAEKWDNLPLSDATHAAMNHGTVKEVPWGLEQTAMPASGSQAGQAAVAAPVTIDGVVAYGRALGFEGRFQVNLPMGETGVWTISHDSMSNDGPDPSADRTLHLDRFSGHVLADVRYADYSAWARAMAWGVAFHEGDLGVWNLALNTLVCLALVALSLSGAVMWWKRRPDRVLRLAAPPRPQGVAPWKGALLVFGGLGLLFPLAGMVILAVAVLDAVVLRHLPGLRRALS